MLPNAVLLKKIMKEVGLLNVDRQNALLKLLRTF